jgi:KUP system potassium uptake protein
VLLTVVTGEEPHIPDGERATVQRLTPGFFRVTLRYGYLDQPDVPLALAGLDPDKGLTVDAENVTYFVGRETLIATDRPGMAIWRERLFGRMARNAERATMFFNIPVDRVIEIGMQVEL